MEGIYLGFDFIDLFASIGGFHLAANRYGGRCVFASEIDSYAMKAYESNFGMAPAGDITKILTEDIPAHDVLFAGFPCQPFSIIGKMEGFEDTQGTLFFEIARILEAKKPAFFILENVKMLAGHDKGRTLATILSACQDIGYKSTWSVLNALDFGLPQKRERTIIVGFLDHNVEFFFPAPIGPGNLGDVLFDDADVPKKYFASEQILAKRAAQHTSEHNPGIWHENKSKHISSYPYSCALRAGASHNYLLVNGIRRLTPREMLRLQGFPDSFKIVCSDNQTRNQAGNAVPVDVIAAVLGNALNASGDLFETIAQTGLA